MPEKEPTSSSLSSSVVSYIRRSRRKVTILFTDIEDSTKYWEKHGDVQGRLMVDMHNRLTFPVIRKFHGKVIKTIGDSIMASFRKPENALKAAIGMQQILEQARQADPSFTLRVRIGIHTGLALVEANDVFGDVVNVAARVEGAAKGNQILVSDSTRRELDVYDFGFVQAGRFKPKGKSALMTVYSCPWEDFESIIDDIKPGSYLPVVARQKVALALFLAASVGIGYFLYLNYLRYLAADNKTIAVLTLNPRLIVEEYPVVLYILGGVILSLALIAWRVQAAPHIALKLLSGGFGFALLFMLGFGLANAPITLLPFAKKALYESRHLFVDIVEDETAIRTAPDEGAETIRWVDDGDVLLQMDTARRRGVRWNKVYLGPDTYGWVIRISPARIGVPETRRSIADKFRFRLGDLYAFLLGAAGFVWGFWNFRLRPV